MKLTLPGHMSKVALHHLRRSHGAIDLAGGSAL